MANYLSLAANGKRTEVTGTAVSTGVAEAGDIVQLNAAGQLDASLLPTGIGADIAVKTAEEAVSAGDLININPATGDIRLADRTNNREAHGFVLAAAAVAETVDVYFEGQNNALTGLTPGTPYFLDTAGAVTSTPTTVSGESLQCLGVACNSTTLALELDAPIIRA